MIYHVLANIYSNQVSKEEMAILSFQYLSNVNICVLLIFDYLDYDLFIIYNSLMFLLNYKSFSLLFHFVYYVNSPFLKKLYKLLLFILIFIKICMGYFIDESFLSYSNEIVIFGIFVKWVSKASQWHVPGSIPSNCSFFWSEDNLMSSQTSFFWGISQIARLG